MKDYLISLYIDNELDLEEKSEFVTAINQSDELTRETLDLLGQERRLKDNRPFVSGLTAPARSTSNKPAPISAWLRSLLQPVPALTAAVVVLAVVAAIFMQSTPEQVPVNMAKAHSEERPYRFVIYQPDLTDLKIIGSFTDWQPIAMEPVGDSGYWSLSLKIMPGEHRYSYLSGNGTRLADPTVWARENDDFGGENSILNIAATI